MGEGGGLRRGGGGGLRRGGGGGLRRGGGGGDTGGGGGGDLGGRGVPLGVVPSFKSAWRASMPLVGFPPEPLRLIPRFKDPLLSSPHRWLPVLLLPKLEMPLLPTPKLRYPTLSRPTFPRASAVQADTPFGRHSSAMSHVQDGHQQLVPALRSIPSAASTSTSSDAVLDPPAPANPSDLRASSMRTWLREKAARKSKTAG